MHNSIRIGLATLASISLLLTGAHTASAATSTTLTVEQDAPVLVNHPDPDHDVNNTGAVLFFAADLRNAKGNKVGELIGQVTTFDVTLDGVAERDRFRELVFNMRKGQIVVLGASLYAVTESPDFGNDNAPTTAVVVGGTGKYAGVRGTVTTKKRSNGTFRHTFKFMN